MKKIFSFITFIFLLMLASITLIAQTNKDKLIVNYYRYFGHDDVHTAWIWQYQPNAGSGVEDHTFIKDTAPDSRWLKLEVDLKDDERYEGSTQIGIIIKEGYGWNGAQQPGGDRHIDLSKVTFESGIGNVYFVQEDVTIYYSIDDADISDKVLDASFQSNKDISIYATVKPDKTIVYSNGMKIQEYTEAISHKYSFSLDSFDISNKYEIELIFGDKTSPRYSVSLRNLYDTEEYVQAFHYDGKLGVDYTNEKSTFRLWSPISDEVNLLLYEQGHPNFNSLGKPNAEINPTRRIAMNAIGKGVWEAEVTEDLEGKYYTFEAKYNNQTHEFVDPYAYSTGANGLRAQIVDFKKTNPNKWEYNSRPQNIKKLTDYIIYELHVRDLTTHPSWGGNPEYAGTFKGVSQGGTSYTDKNGLTVTTGLDHLTELGVNAVHFLPIFDFGYVDETRLKDEDYMAIDGFNWGYMPYNFNTPEGSFSTNPFDGYTRVKELKEMVQALHNRNIHVIMDVVYNHTGETAGSQFEKSMPGYYFRQNSDGSFSNGSGTGNETASERSMFRKYMVDSILFWAKEYNISGFRFDLMALHDVETMNEIRTAVNEIDPNIILYGEPWMGGESPLSGDKRADKNNILKLQNVGAFNDDTRDAIKKQWNKGNTNIDVLNAIRYGVAGATPLDYAHAQGGRQTFHQEPIKTINYVSAHDDETLRDYNFNFNNARGELLELLQKQSNAFVLTSQGVPFLHAGVDFMRSKPVPAGTLEGGDNRVKNGTAGNSYNLPDSVNQLNWENKAKYYDVYNYYRHLIALRRIIPSFTLATKDEVQNRLTFINPTDDNMLIYKIAGDATSPEVVVIHTNSRFGSYTTDKDYIRITNNLQEINVNGLSKVKAGSTLNILDYSTLILVEDNGLFDYDPNAEPPRFDPPVEQPGDEDPIDTPDDPALEEKTKSNLGLILGITIPVVIIAGAGVAAFIVIRKRKS